MAPVAPAWLSFLVPVLGVAPAEAPSRIADSVSNLNSVSGIERIRTSVSDFDLNFLEQEDADSNLSSGSEISVDSAVDQIILEENNPQVSDEFFKAEDFMDVSSCVNSEAPSNLCVEEELLLHIIKEEQLPPRVTLPR